MKKRAISTVLVALLTLSACTGCGSGTSTSSSSDIESSINSTVSLTESSKPALPNTYEKTVEIYEKARKKVDLEDITEESIQWFKDNINTIYDDNEHMEKALYYGCFLETKYNAYGSDNNYGTTEYYYYRIGEQAVIAVKYVYRKSDNVDDSLTQHHYSKLKKFLIEV